jgi:iron complex transport system substrate-binding protein
LRVASLVPAGTEIVAALGAEACLVGISHACDYPPSVGGRQRLTWSPVDAERSGAEIDGQVRALHASGRPVIVVDGPALRAARPDVVLTQDLCDVCAVIDGEVRDLAGAIDPSPAILPLTARTLDAIFSDIRSVAEALRREPAALDLISSLQSRIAALPGGNARPTVPVVVIEWLEPLYLAGHWVPDLVRCAGGRDVGAEPGSHSMRSSWADLGALEPRVILLAICGFGLERAVAEWQRFMAGGSADAACAAALTAPVWALDGNAYTSRPGPRVVRGAELIAHAIEGREVDGLIRLRR